MRFINPMLTVWFKYWLALWMIVCGYSSVCANDLPTVRVAYFNYPPHIATDQSGKPFGPLVEVWEKHLARLGGFNIQWVGPFPFARMLDHMQTGQYADVWAQLTGAPERLARFDTPAKPVMAFSQRLWVRKDDPLTAIANIGDLQGKLIGRLTAGYLPKIMADTQSKFAFDPVGGEDAATQTVMKLGSGRIWGAYFVSAEVLQYAAAKEGKLDQFKALKIVGEVDSLSAYTAEGVPDFV